MTKKNENGLEPNPHQMELWGNVSGVVFPPLCANCGCPAHQRLTYKKEFVYPSGDSEVSDSYVTTPVRVPFCESCIAKHKVEGPGPSLLANLKSWLHNGASLLGTVCFGFAAVVAGYFAVRNFGQGDPQLFYWLVSATGFLLLPTLAMASTLREGTEIMRIEWQNSITKAFDFSDGIATPFRGPAFVCTMRNESFARAFRELNQSLAFDSPRPLVRSENTRTKRIFWLALFVISVSTLLVRFFFPTKG
jgi:hypothetical protein